MKKTNKNMQLGMCFGMCFGSAIGTTIGQTVFDNISIGICMGICIGMGIGMAIGAVKDKAVNEQIEEQGYTVKEITKQENEDSYCVLIQNKKGTETTVIVPKGTMDTEMFCVGDIVFLDEDGELEQAFDTEENN